MPGKVVFIQNRKKNVIADEGKLHLNNKDQKSFLMMR